MEEALKALIEIYNELIDIFNINADTILDALKAVMTFGQTVLLELIDLFTVV